MPEIFTATGNSVCCLQRIGKKPLPHFHIFLLPTFLQTAKSKTPQTPFTAVLAVESFFLGKFPLTAERPFFFVFLKRRKTHSGCAENFCGNRRQCLLFATDWQQVFCPIFTFSYYIPFYKPQSQKRSNTAYCGSCKRHGCKIYGCCYRME